MSVTQYQRFLIRAHPFLQKQGSVYSSTLNIAMLVGGGFFARTWLITKYKY